MTLFSVIIRLILSFGSGAQEPSLVVPDSAIAGKFEWAQRTLPQQLSCADSVSCDDVAINALALTGLGHLDTVRAALRAVQHRTPLWLVAAHQYWLASADDAFLREQWWSIANLLSSNPQPRLLNDGGVLLAAVDGTLAMARVMNDSLARERTRSLYALAEQRAQEHPGVVAPAFGLLNAELADAHMTQLADTVHARWPLASGLIALGLYEYHRAAPAFSLVQRMAAADAAAAMVVLPLLRGLLGWDADTRHRALALEPHLPVEWDALAVNGLSFGREKVDIEIRRGAGTYSIQVTRAQASPPIALHVSPAFARGTRIRSVKVNDADVATQIESNAHDLHVVVEASLAQETSIEIEYDAPRRRASLR